MRSLSVVLSAHVLAACVDAMEGPRCTDEVCATGELVAGSPDDDPLAADDDAIVPSLAAIPPTLADTGLYTVNGHTHVEQFAPRWALYTDGADKQRFISLPPNAQIDTSNPDFWKFPIGTKLWKHFSRNGTPVETRYMAKYGPSDDDWLFIAYQWSLSAPTDPTAALPVPAGVTNANNTPHDIPAQDVCLDCHGNVTSRVLGFSTFQLDYDAPAPLLDRATAQARDYFSTPVARYPVPGTTQQRATLGYFHANCGHCHHSRSPLINRPMFRLETTHISSVTATRTYQSTVNVSGLPYGGATVVAKPGDPDRSIIVTRMRSADPKKRMPALGTETVDSPALQMICAWINSL